MNYRLKLVVSLSALLGAACPEPMMMMGTGGGGATGGGATGGGTAMGGGAATGGGGASGPDCASFCAGFAGLPCAASCATECGTQATQANALGCGAQLQTFLSCAARPGNSMCNGTSVVTPTCVAEAMALGTCSTNAISCQAVCARAATQASACSANCEANCATSTNQANIVGCSFEFETAARCYVTSSAPFTCSGATLTPPSMCATQSSALASCVANNTDAGTGGGGGMTGGGGGMTGGGGGPTGGGGGSTGGGAATGGGVGGVLTMCQAFDPPVRLSDSTAPPGSGFTHQVAVTEAGDALFAWWDGENMNWASLLASGAAGPSATVADAGTVDTIDLEANGPHGFSVYSSRSASFGSASTIARRFSAAGWETPDPVSVPASGLAPQRLALEPDGTATFWRLWTSSGAAEKTLEEFRSTGAGPLTNSRVISDAGTALLMTAGGAMIRMVAFAEPQGVSLLQSHPTMGDNLTPFPAGTNDFVGAVARDQSGAVFAATAPTGDGGRALTAVGATGLPRQLGTTGDLMSVRRAVGALSGPQGRALVAWLEAPVAGPSSLYVATEGPMGWSQPQLISAVDVGGLEWHQLNDTVAVASVFDGNTRRWFELHTNGFVSQPFPVPLLGGMVIVDVAASANRAAVIGTATLPDGGTGIYAAQCR